MGMYTEFHYNVELSKDTPAEVITILTAMVQGDTTALEVSLPDHPFFQATRWRRLFTCDSYYFAGDTIASLRYDDFSRSNHLCIRSNLKNYDSEIEKFCDWFDQYVDAFAGDFLGFYRYEQSEDPVIIRKRS